MVFHILVQMELIIKWLLEAQPSSRKLTMPISPSQQDFESNENIVGSRSIFQVITRLAIF